MAQRTTYDMAKSYPLIGKIISVSFFSGMGVLLLYIAIDEGPKKLFLLVIDALALVSIPATYLLCAWIGYRFLQIYLSEAVVPGSKLRFLLKNIRPFLPVPILALMSGGFLLYLHGSELGNSSAIWWIMLAFPVISFFIGLGVAIFISIFKK